MRSYNETAQEKLQALMQKQHACVLAIETSCDETAAAVVEDGRRVLSNKVHTQIPLHTKYGGVVPEIASRNHVEMLPVVVERALTDAGMTLGGVDAIAVTNAPGLVGALLTGVSYAKGLAIGAGLPLIGTDHILSHIAANYLTYPDLTPPFCCLVASGGHSHIVLVADYGKTRLIGTTRDDAAGEAFDKVARALSLPYPGGPALEALAKSGDPRAFSFHSAFNEGAGYDFSFSGIKTAVVNLLHTSAQRGEVISRADVAASFQHTVVSILTNKAVRAAKEFCPPGKAPVLALAGGVSANKTLRAALTREAKKHGVRFCCPEICYCTDNAAMVGSAGFYLLMQGESSGLDLNAVPS